jgi:hypothetical protein
VLIYYASLRITMWRNTYFVVGILLKCFIAGCQWLTSVILGTQKAEIKRIMVQSQPRQIVFETLSWKNPSQKKASGVAQGVGPEFKPQYHQKKKKKWTLLTLQENEKDIKIRRSVSLNIIKHGNADAWIGSGHLGSRDGTYKHSIILWIKFQHSSKRCSETKWYKSCCHQTNRSNICSMLSSSQK